MKTNIEIGSKVKIMSLENNSVNKNGEIGIVTAINSEINGARVYVHGNGNAANWECIDELELINTPEENKILLKIEECETRIRLENLSIAALKEKLTQINLHTK